MTTCPKCGAPTFEATRRENGRKVVLDGEPKPNGVYRVEAGIATVSRSPQESRYRPHAATCPGNWSGPKQAVPDRFQRRHADY